MSRREPVAGVPQRHPYLDQLAGHEWLRIRVRSAMREVQDPGRDPRGRPVGRHVGKADHGGRDGRVDREVQDRDRLAQDGQRLDEGSAREDRPHRFVRPEVARQAVGDPAGAPGQAPAGADRRSVPIGVHAARHRTPLHEPAGECHRSAFEEERPDHRRRMRKGVGRPPPPGPRFGERLRLRVLPLEPDDRRLLVEPVGYIAQPSVEEPDDLVELVEGRPRRRVVGPAVDPVADEGPRRRGASRLHPERRIDIRVAPAADAEDRRVDRVVVRRQGAGPPVRPVGLLAQPRDEPWRRRLESSAPLVEPGFAAEPGIRRHRVHRDLADRVLRELAGGDAPADVVDVGAVPVVGRLDRHDRPQVRRAQLGDLDRGEAAVRDAPHPDRARAPRLGGQPFDGIEAVARLVLGVLVERDAAR